MLGSLASLFLPAPASLVYNLNRPLCLQLQVTYRTSPSATEHLICPFFCNKHSHRLKLQRWNSLQQVVYAYRLVYICLFTERHPAGFKLLALQEICSSNNAASHKPICITEFHLCLQLYSYKVTKLKQEKSNFEQLDQGSSFPPELWKLNKIKTTTQLNNWLYLLLLFKKTCRGGYVLIVLLFLF